MQKTLIATTILAVTTIVVALAEWDLMIVLYVAGGVSLLVGVFYLFFVWQVPKSWEPQEKGTPQRPFYAWQGIKSSPESNSVRSFYTKVVGVTHENRDGSSRQEIIARYLVGEPLELRREPDNPHDSQAIAVCRESGEQLGYISTDIGWRLADEIDGGKEFRASLSSLTGGHGSRPVRGVNILIHVM